MVLRWSPARRTLRWIGREVLYFLAFLAVLLLALTVASREVLAHSTIARFSRAHEDARRAD